MMKKLLLSLGVILLGISISYAQQSTFKGTVTDNTGMPVAYANIYLKQEGKVLNGGMTDAKGDYQIFGVSPGTYDLEFKGPMGCGNTYTKTGISIGSGAVQFVNFEVSCATDLPPVTVTYQPPVFDPTKTTSGDRMSGDDVRKTPGYSLNNAIASMQGVTTQNGEILSVRGNRDDGQTTIIDGVRMRGGNAVSMQSIEDVELIQGGIPAEYGDGTSFTVLTTKGVSKDFHGSVELRGSLEGYNNFLIAGALTGPILKGKLRDDPARIGFLLTAEAGYNQESRPLRGGSWIAKQSVIDEIAQKPLLYDDPYNQSVYHSAAEYLKADRFEKVRVTKDEYKWNYLVQGKIDFLAGKTHNVRISLGGSYQFDKRKSFPYSTYVDNSLFNSAKNFEYQQSTMRFNARLNHRVYTNTSDSSLLKNVMYDINVNYTKSSALQQDPVHKNKLFNYGHVGYFKKERRPFYTRMDEFIISDSLDNPQYIWYDMVVLETYYDSVLIFTPGTANPYLTNYTSNFVNAFSPDMIEGNYDMETYRTYGALMNGDQPSLIYGMYTPPGYSYSSYSRNELTSIGAKASLSLNIGNHEIKLGYEFEKLTERGFGISPTVLWQTMRNLQNRHMAQLDMTNPIISNDTISFNNQVNIAQQSLFDKNLREKLGQDPNGYDGFWLDIDNYDPDMFSLDMFSAEELLNATDGSSLIIDYYGYDYTGSSKDRQKTDIERFLTARDANGNRIYSMGAYEPVYMALYVQDKFSIQSLLFNVGLRVDRFDANQQVLRDPFLFRPGVTLKELKDVGFDFKGGDDNWYVYVNQSGQIWDGSNEGLSVVGYRSYDETSGTSTWYNDEGQEVVDPSTMLGTGGALYAPSKYDSGEDAITITPIRPEAFRDYKVQWAVMPRISFSFPVSDNSLFTAHYNIITNRPPNIRINPARYLYINEQRTNVLENPALRPQQSIDYEVGFTQKVGDKSAVSIVAYYSEKRDQVQVYYYAGAQPADYYSYANIDFGTVQGFSLSYTLRRTKNISLRASYTIQFAKGTGSDPASNLRIIQSGQPNLRTLSNLEFDQRHRFSANIDYRFDGGADYNGPTTVKQTKDGKRKTIKWLENTGATLIFSAGSGLPYSRSAIPNSTYVTGTSRRLSGSINGSYKPWNFQCDLRIDKTFTFNLNNNAKDKEGNQKNAKPGFLTVYLDIQNLFNFKNVIRVYDYTGNADDDGYLAAAEYQRQINSQVDVLSFTNYYQMRVNNPYNYSTPFTITLGVQFGF